MQITIGRARAARICMYECRTNLRLNLNSLGNIRCHQSTKFHSKLSRHLPPFIAIHEVTCKAPIWTPSRLRSRLDVRYVKISIDPALKGPSVGLHSSMCASGAPADVASEHNRSSPMSHCNTYTHVCESIDTPLRCRCIIGVDRWSTYLNLGMDVALFCCGTGGRRSQVDA